nr:cytidine deaminase [Desulfosporosinus sp.]
MRHDESQTSGVIEQEIQEMISQEVLDELILHAKAAYEQAYVPYSHYPVGSAALFSSGKIYSGCNVENASYGLTICAERNAIFQAIARGERVLKGIAIAVPSDVFPSPCGACRQVIREFALDCPVVLINGQGQMRWTSLKSLLPEAFGPEYLELV